MTINFPSILFGYKAKKGISHRLIRIDVCTWFHATRCSRSKQNFRKFPSRNACSIYVCTYTHVDSAILSVQPTRCRIPRLHFAILSPSASASIRSLFLYLSIPPSLPPNPPSIRRRVVHGAFPRRIVASYLNHSIFESQ